MSKKDLQRIYGAHSIAIVVYFALHGDIPRLWVYISCAVFFLLFTWRTCPKKYIWTATVISMMYLFLINRTGFALINVPPQPIIWKKQTIRYDDEVKKQHDPGIIKFIESRDTGDDS